MQRCAPRENGRLLHMMACFLTAVGVPATLWVCLPVVPRTSLGVKLFRVAGSVDPALDVVPCRLLQSGAACVILGAPGRTSVFECVQGTWKLGLLWG